MYSKSTCVRCVYIIHSVYICNIKRHTKNNNAIEAQKWADWLKTGSNFVALFLDTMIMKNLKIAHCIVDQPPGCKFSWGGDFENNSKTGKKCIKEKKSSARGQLRGRSFTASFRDESHYSYSLKLQFQIVVNLLTSEKKVILTRFLHSKSFSK